MHCGSAVGPPAAAGIRAERSRILEVIYLLIPVSLILLGGILWVLLWAVRDGQYDDLEGPAHRILMDEDKVVDDSQKKSRREDVG